MKNVNTMKKVIASFVAMALLAVPALAGTVSVSKATPDGTLSGTNEINDEYCVVQTHFAVNAQQIAAMLHAYNSSNVNIANASQTDYNTNAVMTGYMRTAHNQPITVYGEHWVVTSSGTYSVFSTNHSNT